MPEMNPQRRSTPWLTIAPPVGRVRSHKRAHAPDGGQCVSRAVGQLLLTKPIGDLSSDDRKRGDQVHWCVNRMVASLLTGLDATLCLALQD